MRCAPDNRNKVRAGYEQTSFRFQNARVMAEGEILLLTNRGLIRVIRPPSFDFNERIINYKLPDFSHVTIKRTASKVTMNP